MRHPARHSPATHGRHARPTVGRTMRAKLCAVAIGLSVVLAGGVRPAAGTVDVPVEKTTLANGLTVLVHEDRDLPVVSLYIFFHTGSRNERPGITGISHLFEHMMFNGGENTEGKFDEIIEGNGGSTNGYTTRDFTVYLESFPPPALERVLWIEADRMRALAITPKNLEQERGIVKEERRLRTDDDPERDAVRADLPQRVRRQHLPLGADRVHGRHRRDHARGRQELLPHPLRAEQRDRRARRRGHPQRRLRARGALLRRHSAADAAASGRERRAAAERTEDARVPQGRRAAGGRRRLQGGERAPSRPGGARRAAGHPRARTELAALPLDRAPAGARERRRRELQLGHRSRALLGLRAGASRARPPRRWRRRSRSRSRRSATIRPRSASSARQRTSCRPTTYAA